MPSIRTSRGGFFFDLKTMEPLVNTPGWVRGLQLFVEAQKAFPPGGNNFGLGDEIFSFGGGQSLMSYSWDDAFIQAMQEDSRIRNKVAAAPLPGADEVWNRQTGKWDKFFARQPRPLHHLGLDLGCFQDVQEQGHGF